MLLKSKSREVRRVYCDKKKEAMSEKEGRKERDQRMKEERGRK